MLPFGFYISLFLHTEKRRNALVMILAFKILVVFETKFLLHSIDFTFFISIYSWNFFFHILIQRYILFYSLFRPSLYVFFCCVYFILFEKNIYWKRRRKKPEFVVRRNERKSSIKKRKTNNIFIKIPVFLLFVRFV